MRYLHRKSTYRQLDLILVSIECRNEGKTKKLKLQFTETFTLNSFTHLDER